jgi:hypothetical protein
MQAASFKLRPNLRPDAYVLSELHHLLDITHIITLQIKVTEMADDIVLPIPNLKLPQYHFILTEPKLAHLHEKAGVDLLKGIEADGEHSNNSLLDRICDNSY